MTGIVENTVFRCNGQQLVGVLHRAEDSALRGILVIVGGPQYRVGAHRQFVHLGRALSAAGYPVFRFDYRGIGDSDGDSPGFENIDADICAAIDAFQELCPEIRELVIWGLCDAACAALFYSYKDSRVKGLILLNPWIRSQETLARSYLADYYSSRLFQRGFWAKAMRGELHISRSVTDFVSTLYRSVFVSNTVEPDGSLPARMLAALDRFAGEVLIVLSGNDLTAGEFRARVRTAEWQKVLARPGLQIKQLIEADHTFSRQTWRDTVARHCVDWLAF